MIKETVTESEFIHAFDRMNRSNNFTVEGRRALFEYLEQFSEDTGADVELDVIAICCEYNEYENIAEFQKDYGEEYETIDDIRDRTEVIKIDDDAFIILAF